jgi:hypothetical protein
MAHISSISAAMFTDLACAYGTIASGAETVAPVAPAGFTQANWEAKFDTTTGTNSYFRFLNARSFPAVGTPSNIVNVPVFGQKVAQTIGGQSNAPTMDVTLNYIPSLWAKGATASAWTAGLQTTFGTELANMVSDGVSRPFRLALLASASTATAGASLGPYDSNATGLGSVPNSEFYWMGKMESLLVTPSLTDATTAVLSLSIQSDFYGAWTATMA